MDSVAARTIQFIRHQALALCFLTLSGFFLLGWWNSANYSERHLIRLGPVAIDTFSANSLLRISFVNGAISGWGTDTRYRQPNPRGKFLLRPASPSFILRNSKIFEVSLGYWHLVIGAVCVSAACFTASLVARKN